MSRKYKIVSEDGKVFKVISVENEVWSEAHSTKGAVIGAMVCGIRLKDIDFNGNYVPIKECLEVVL